MTAAGWLSEAVSAFGLTCKAKLDGPGDQEAAIRSPLEALLGAAGVRLGVRAVFHDEVRDTTRQVRPDYAVAVNGAIMGYVEVKAPGHTIDPAALRGHDLEQWERQRDLPNLLYTNGTQWRLYRGGDPVGDPVGFTGGDLARAGAKLAAPEAFETLITDFLRWKPAPITSVGVLVRAVAPLTRLLRGEVTDQLATEARAVAGGASPDDQPFTGLANDWRALLFPEADDPRFADGYAQAVTFALLLARTEGIDLEGVSLHEVGTRMSGGYSLMGRALQLLTQDVAADFRVTLDLLVRVVGAVDWPRVRAGRRDTYLRLYEDFLGVYDNDLRKQTGTYYTPVEVVEPMVRLVEEALVSRLGLAGGFRDESVHVVDPAMGTGTFLLDIMERVAAQEAAQTGPGMVPGAMSALASRLTGFELQMGPYAVAELRAADLMDSHGVTSSGAGPHLYVTNTLDDPFVEQRYLPAMYKPIALQRLAADKVKAKADITVVLGNPPYDDRAEGRGGWVERGGDGAAHERAILDDFRDPDTARHFHNLKNLYVYFWRWATWKVWESTPQYPDGDAGVVCFITTSGYVAGPGFTGMRRYLRQWASEGWIIDLTPEGQTPDIPTRIFPGVRQPLAIGLFVRTPDAPADVPAVVHTRVVDGLQGDKFAALAGIALDGSGWTNARSGWTAPFTAAAGGGWDRHPAMDDLLPWTSPGVTGNRRWPYAPSPEILKRRWSVLAQANPDGPEMVRFLADLPPEARPEVVDRATARAVLFKETRDRGLARDFDALPGVVDQPDEPVGDASGAFAQPVRVGYRSFDRQWILPDSRVLDMPRRDLWAARQTGQVFVVEQHSQQVESGPGVVFSAQMPDLHHFNNRGGRTLPFLHPDGTPNLAPGLVDALASRLGIGVTPRDVLAYVAGVVAHPAFTRTFTEELTTPGIRVPLTREVALWREAVALGETVLWLHTYGAAFAGPGRPAGDVHLPGGDPRRPQYLAPITGLPAQMSYDAERAVLRIGDGEFGPVPPAVWAYDVGGKNVLKSWFNYRKADPGGKKTSPLDHIHVENWDPDWSRELVELLSVLVQLVALEPAQADLLAAILAGGVWTRDDLTEVAWPATPADRKPRHARIDSGDTLPGIG